MFTVTNLSSIETGTLSATVGGQDVADFPINLSAYDGNGWLCQGFSLNPAESCQIFVNFKASLDGQETASLRVSDTAANTATVALSGSGSPAELSISPATGAFGAQPLQSTTSITFTLTNQSPVTTGSLFTSTGTFGGSFLISADACADKPLGPGATCQLSVVFIPSTSGAQTATLTVTDDLVFTATAALSGSGS